MLVPYRLPTSPLTSLLISLRPLFLPFPSLAPSPPPHLSSYLLSRELRPSRTPSTSTPGALINPVTKTPREVLVSRPSQNQDPTLFLNPAFDLDALPSSKPPSFLFFTPSSVHATRRPARSNLSPPNPAPFSFRPGHLPPKPYLYSNLIPRLHQTQ